jgi:hypothetical protein
VSKLSIVDVGTPSEACQQKKPCVLHNPWQVTTELLPESVSVSTSNVPPAGVPPHSGLSPLLTEKRSDDTSVSVEYL